VAAACRVVPLRLVTTASRAVGKIAAFTLSRVRLLQEDVPQEDELQEDELFVPELAVSKYSSTTFGAPHSGTGLS